MAKDRRSARHAYWPLMIYPWAFGLTLGTYGFWLMGGNGIAWEENRSGIQQKQERNAIPQNIKENTIIFYSVSKEDYENLGYPDREGGEGLGELLGDYLYQAMKLQPKLEQHGIRVIFSMFKEASFQMPDGKTKKIIFDPRSIYEMAMYAKGQEPKRALGFYLGN